MVQVNHRFVKWHLSQPWLAKALWEHCQPWLTWLTIVNQGHQPWLKSCFFWSGLGWNELLSWSLWNYGNCVSFEQWWPLHMYVVHLTQKYGVNCWSRTNVRTTKSHHIFLRSVTHSSRYSCKKTFHSGISASYLCFLRVHMWGWTPVNLLICVSFLKSVHIELEHEFQHFSVKLR